MVPTRDHDHIQQWAEQHGGQPAQIRRLKFDGEPATLTFLFGEPGIERPEIHPISWESFFAQFDLLGLSIAFDEDTTQFDIVKVDGPSPTGLPH